MTKTLHTLLGILVGVLLGAGVFYGAKALRPITTEAPIQVYAGENVEEVVREVIDTDAIPPTLYICDLRVAEGEQGETVYLVISASYEAMFFNTEGEYRNIAQFYEGTTKEGQVFYVADVGNTVVTMFNVATKGWFLTIAINDGDTGVFVCR
jgi:hypothetical protein